MKSVRSWLTVLLLVFVIAGLYSALLLPRMRTFHIADDDFSLILNSARQYHPNPWLWVTRGFSSYFVNFPGLPETGNDFCRPVINASFWLDSLLSPGTGPRNLTTNLLGLGLTLILFVFFVRREASSSVLSLSSMLIVYAFSAVWYGTVRWPSDRDPLLMALFALAAFLLLPSEGTRHPGLRLTLSILSQFASLLSHEIGVVTPVIAATLFVLRRDGKINRGRLKLLPLFLLPLLCSAALRLAFYHGVGHAYVLEPTHGWVRSGIIYTVELLACPFFPWETVQVTSGELSLRVLLGALMNLVGYALVAWALVRPGNARRGPLLRILLCLGVALSVCWIGPIARRFALAAVFGGLATIVAAEQIARSSDRLWVRRGTKLALIALAAGQLLIYLTSLRPLETEGEANSRQARVEFEGLQKAIANASVPTLLLVNDTSGWTGARAMLEMAAWPNRGQVGRLITVNNFSGGSSPQSSLTISRAGQAVRIEIAAGQGQHLDLCTVVKSQLGSTFASQDLQYEVQFVRSYSFLARLLRHFGKSVGPDNVEFGNRLVVTVPPEIARNGLLVVGFDPRDTSRFINLTLR